MLASKFIPPLGLALNPNVLTKTFEADKRIRARITPKQIRSSRLFAPETLSWLKTCSINISSDSKIDGSTNYSIPILGITNRPLRGYKKAGLNLFKTLAKINTGTNLHNFDQCLIEFGPRLPINANDFIEEMFRQIYSSSSRVKTKGKFTFFCHNSCNTAIASDLGTLRLSVIKTMPVINIDWLDPSLSWETLWNPCSDLEPVKTELEEKLIKFLDELIESICAGQCNALIQRHDSFFDRVYLSHRNAQKLPALNKIVFLPSTDMQNNRILELFKPEKDLLNCASQKSYRKTNKTISLTQKDSDWLPVTL